ncbi:MAG: hypothetical protein ACI8WM_002423 [Burkholderiaceae bacterium]|jgi:hypothetical protein
MLFETGRDGVDQSLLKDGTSTPAEPLTLSHFNKRCDPIMPIISSHTVLPAARIARTLSGTITLPVPVERPAGKIPDSRMAPRTGQSRGVQLRSELAAKQLAKNTSLAPLATLPRRSPPQRHLDHAHTDNSLAAARLSLFFLDLIRTDTLPPERQVRELQAQARRLPQLSQSHQADAFNLMLALSNKLPASQQAPVLAILAPRLRTLPTGARRSGFEALATSVARLPQENRAIALPALACALPASGRDAGKFHTVRAQTQTLDTNAQGRALPGLIRHIGVLPKHQRKAAFDAIALQVQTLPLLQQRNALRGLAGKIGKLPTEQQAQATSRLQQQAEKILRT